MKREKVYRRRLSWLARREGRSLIVSLEVAEEETVFDFEDDDLSEKAMMGRLKEMRAERIDMRALWERWEEESEGSQKGKGLEEGNEDEEEAGENEGEDEGEDEDDEVDEVDEEDVDVKDKDKEAEKEDGRENSSNWVPLNFLTLSSK